MIELPSDEPIQYVGVYVLRWGALEPTVGFREATDEEIAAESGVVDEVPHCTCKAGTGGHASWCDLEKKTQKGGEGR